MQQKRERERERNLFIFPWAIGLFLPPPLPPTVAFLSSSYSCSSSFSSNYYQFLPLLLHLLFLLYHLFSLLLPLPRFSEKSIKNVALIMAPRLHLLHDLEKCWPAHRCKMLAMGDFRTSSTRWLWICGHASGKGSATVSLQAATISMSFAYRLPVISKVWKKMQMAKLVKRVLAWRRGDCAIWPKQHGAATFRFLNEILHLSYVNINM